MSFGTVLFESLFAAFFTELGGEEKALAVPNIVTRLKPRLIASEACHRLALNEEQKENKWKRNNFSTKNGGKIE